MRAFLASCALAWTVAQTTRSGCLCKSSSEVKWQLAGGGVGGGFSHSGCGTGPYEAYSPAQGQNWCDTQQSSCNNGQGWDLCTKTSKGSKDLAEAVNVNFGVVPQPQSNQPGVNLNVNVNVGGGSQAPITTAKGCTCHATSEVILMQNGVRVGGGFSHTGCGTGPFEANSPGKGSPWCDTIETWCSAGWDLCTPPAVLSSQSSQNSYTPLFANSDFTAYSSDGAYTSPLTAPTPFVAPPVFQPPTPQPYVPPANPFQPFQTSQATQTSSSRPAQTPSYQTQQQQYRPSAYSSGASARGTFSRSQPQVARRGRRGGFDYSYDDSSGSSSSSSSLLPLMLMSKGTSSGSTSSSSNLLPLLLASQNGGGGGSSSLLPMMMMSGGFGGSSGIFGGSSSSSSSSSMLNQLAMFSAFRREGEGEAQDAASLGDIGQTLGFTRAVVVSNSKSTSDQNTTSSNAGHT